MIEDDKYRTPTAVEDAIKSAAKNASALNPTLNQSERIRLEYFNRFLSRIFSEESQDTWLLKGGTAMLARVATARATTDIDFLSNSHSLDESVDDLKHLASIDLGDHFRFEYVSHHSAIRGEQQNYVDGCRVKFDVYIGTKRKNPLNVDIVVDAITTDDIETVIPANILKIPKLRSNPYRLYPVVDQIADKVCATLSLYDGQASSREKDLIDLVVLATTQKIDRKKLTKALRIEASMRPLDLPPTMTIPKQWGAAYKKAASSVPDCREYPEVADALQLMHSFIDPVLSGNNTEATWDPSQRMWL